MGNYELERRQQLALSSVAVLSPALRIFPALSTQLAGRAVWLSSLLALPPLLGYACFMCRFLDKRNEGEGLCELIMRAAGNTAGRIVTAVMALWLLFYSAFLFRAGAERFITTIYPNSQPGEFIIPMAVLALISALGTERGLGRSAKMALPVLAFSIIVILVFALLSADLNNLLPVTVYDLPRAALGALPEIDVALFAIYCPAFLEGAVKKSGVRFKSGAAWILVFTLLMLSLSVAVVGSFGASLTARLTRPFFSLVRNLVFFHSLERVEALVVTLWIFPDFLASSLALFACQLCLRKLLGYSVDKRGVKLFFLGDGRYLIFICAVSSALLAIFMAPESHILRLYSEGIVPGINLALALLLLPAVYIVGRRKNRI